MHLKRNEAVIDVYKKKVDQMADLRAELLQSEELNQKLNADIEMLQQEKEQDLQLEEVVQRVQHELQNVKSNADQKELLLQEVSFNLKDAEGRVVELENKETFYKN